MKNADPPGVAHLDLGAINFAMPLFEENPFRACAASSIFPAMVQ